MITIIILYFLRKELILIAGVVKLVNTPDLESGTDKGIWVRFPSPVHIFMIKTYQMNKIKIALQKSGRLYEESIKFLKDCGINITFCYKDKLRALARNFPMEVFFYVMMIFQTIFKTE